MPSFLQSLIDFHPLRFFLACLIVPAALGIAAAWVRRSGAKTEDAEATGRRRLMRGLIIFALLALAPGLAGLIFELRWYVPYPVAGWPLEPQVLCVSELARRGEPLYPDPATTGLVYGQVYGPALYYTYATVFQWFGSGFIQAKVASLLAMLGALGLLGWTLRRFDRSTWLWGFGVAVAAFCDFGVYAFGIRPEPFILLALGVFLFSLTLRSEWGSGLLAALAGGWLLAIKPSGALYLAAPFVFTLFRRGFLWTTLTGLGSLAVLAVPFLLPNVDWSHYLQGLKGATHIPWGHVRWTGIFQIAAMILLLPAVKLGECLVSGDSARGDKIRLTIVVITLTLSMLGTWMGVGRLLAVVHHFLPYLPVALFVLCAARKPGREHPPGIMLVSVAATLIATFALRAAFASYRPHDTPSAAKAARESEEIVAELQSSVARNPGKVIQMGYGEGGVDVTGSPTLYRAALVFAGQPYFLDGEAAMEIPFRGLDPSMCLDRLIRGKKVDLWLIPKGEAAFRCTSSYDQKRMFGDDVVRLFDTAHQRAAGSGTLDVFQRKD